MNWEATKESMMQLGDSGVGVEVERTDGQPQCVYVHMQGKPLLRVALTGYGSIGVSVPAKPKTVKRHQLSGTVRGLKVLEHFEDKYEANERLEELGNAQGSDDPDLKIVEVDVPEDQVK